MITYFFRITRHVATVQLEQCRTVNQGNQLQKTSSFPPHQCILSPIRTVKAFKTSQFPQIKNTLRGQPFSTPEKAVDAFKSHILEVEKMRSGKNASKVSSNACKNVLIFMEHILKNNRAISYYEYLFSFVYLKS